MIDVHVERDHRIAVELTVESDACRFAGHKTLREQIDVPVREQLIVELYSK